MGYLLCTRHWSKCLAHSDVQASHHSKGSSTALPIHTGRWRLTGPPGTHSSSHNRCARVCNQSNGSRAQAFIYYIFKLVRAITSNYEMVSHFFSFLFMTAFSRFLHLTASQLKTHTKSVQLAKCCTIPVQYTLAEWLWGPPSSAHVCSFQHESIFDGLWKAAMLTTAF